MRRINHILAATLLAGSFSMPALAQTSDTASADADGKARIVQPITLTKTADLNFGTIVKPATGSGTVSIDQATGTRSVTGGATGVTSTTGRATFNVGGEGGQSFGISVPATFNIASGGDTITVTPVASAATGSLTGTIGSAGTATFGVGGSFPLPSTQASGNYIGTLTATVTYN